MMVTTATDSYQLNLLSLSLHTIPLLLPQFRASSGLAWTDPIAAHLFSTLLNTLQATRLSSKAQIWSCHAPALSHLWGEVQHQPCCFSPTHMPCVPGTSNHSTFTDTLCSLWPASHTCHSFYLESFHTFTQTPYLREHRYHLFEKGFLVIVLHARSELLVISQHLGLPL